MTEDKFFERLSADAQALRYVPDDVAMTRMAARIRARAAAPTSVAQLLAAWFRPLAAALSAVALAATIGIVFAPADDTDLGANPVEISMAGDNYVVAE
jgi:hypothetical protein